MADTEYKPTFLDSIPYKYWDKITQISYLQRRILVYSITYYLYNDTLVSDQAYDKMSAALVEAQKSVPEDVLKHTQYYYCMHDFDGNTGFDLYYRLNDKDKQQLTNIASSTLGSMRRGEKVSPSKWSKLKSGKRNGGAQA